MSEDNNDQNCINNDEIFNDKIKNILSNILEYDSNFENYIKSYSKKYFWKNIIFLKLGGQDKLLHEIIKGIHNYNININKKHKLPVNSYIKDNPKTSLLIITHYHRILSYIKPDYVHILKDGNIKKTGDYKLVEEIEKNGYKMIGD